MFIKNIYLQATFLDSVLSLGKLLPISSYIINSLNLESLNFFKKVPLNNEFLIVFGQYSRQAEISLMKKYSQRFISILDIPLAQKGISSILETLYPRVYSNYLLNSNYASYNQDVYQAIQKDYKV